MGLQMFAGALWPKSALISTITQKYIFKQNSKSRQSNGKSTGPGRSGTFGHLGHSNQAFFSTFFRG